MLMFYLEQSLSTACPPYSGMSNVKRQPTEIINIFDKVIWVKELELIKEEKLFLCYRNTPKHEHELAITGLALFQSLNGCNKHESSDTWNHIS